MFKGLTTILILLSSALLSGYVQPYQAYQPYGDNNPPKLTMEEVISNFEYKTYFFDYVVCIRETYEVSGDFAQ